MARGAGAAPGKDSPIFEAGLDASKQQLDVTPREIVRFTNASRFLYEVVTSGSEATKSAESIDYDEFFDLMVARWTHRPERASNTWMKRQLDIWLPALRVSPERPKDPRN